MKKNILFSILTFYGLLISISKADIITLDLLNPTYPTEITLNDQGYWTETFNTEYRTIEFDLFSFTHMPTGFGGTEVGGGMSYWDGFTYCTNGDNSNYGMSGNSDGWLENQWGCMAGGGIKTNENGDILIENGKVTVEKGIPYLAAYWGYWVELVENGDPCLQVNFKDNELYDIQGLYVCNHPWPYYGNLCGDGFANPFSKEGDFFKLIVHGFNENKEDIGVKIEYMLAEFKNGEIHQSADWEWIDLSALKGVSGIYFTMESSDIHPIVELGPNTAVYFCIDKLQIKKTEISTRPTRPDGLAFSATENTIDFKWNASSSVVGVKGYNLYLDGEFKDFVEETNYTFTDLKAFTKYEIEVEVVANDETLSLRASLTATTTDETPPTAPTGLKAETTAYNIELSWTASTDNVAVEKYYVYVDGAPEKAVTNTFCTLTGIEPGATYQIEVEARDGSNNRSEKAGITVTTKELSTDLSINQESGFIYYDRLIQSLTIESHETGHMTIYNSFGTKIITEKVFQGVNIIDLSKLSNGLYIIKWNQHAIKVIN